MRCQITKFGSSYEIVVIIPNDSYIVTIYKPLDFYNNEFRYKMYQNDKVSITKFLHNSFYIENNKFFKIKKLIMSRDRETQDLGYKLLLNMKNKKLMVI